MDNDDKPDIRIIHPSMEADLLREQAKIEEAKRPKRKYQRRAYARKVRLMPHTPDHPPPLEPKPKVEAFPGMTAKLCPTACNPETGCVISGDICVHPYISGGLQAPHQMKPDVKRRFEAAKDYLKHQAIDQRVKA